MNIMKIILAILFSFSFLYRSFFAYSPTVNPTSYVTNFTQYDTIKANNVPLYNYVLAVTYGKDYCVTDGITCSTPIDLKRFTFHGLWPNAITTTPPQKPQKPTTTLDEHNNSLRVQWPDLSWYKHSGKYERFWNFEWRKHGTGSAFDKLSYFKRTMELNRLVDASYILYHLPPGNNNWYNVADIERIHTDTNFPIPYIVCTNPGRRQVLTELYYCFDPTATHLHDCSNYYSINTNCKGNFRILT
ncbi:Intracellular ribonuclease LX [Bienertia sinuspersici]